MSNQNFGTGQVLFSGSTTGIKTVKVPIVIGTAQIRRDFLQELGMHMVKLQIDNLDALNPLTFRVEPFGTLETIPISTRGDLIDEIHHFLEINPDAVSGTGNAFVFLAPIEELQKKGLIAS